MKEARAESFVMPIRGLERRILFLAQLPPPVHGATVISHRVFGMLEDMENVSLTHLWGGSARTLHEIGKKDVRKIFSFLGLLAQLMGRICSTIRYDIAYLTFTPWAHTAIRDAILVSVSKLLATRTLVHVHAAGLEMVLQPGSVRFRLIRRLLMGAELIAITDDTSRIARNSGIFTHVHSLTNSVPDPGVPTIIKRRKITCGCLSNMDRRKGVLRFVDTIAGLRRAGLPVEGMIAGGPTQDLSVGDVRSYAAKKGVEEFVNVRGQVIDEGKSKFLSELDLFIYLSKHDLAPLALIEAMAHGAAPIVFDTGGIRQMVGAYFAKNVLCSRLEADACQAQISEIVQRYWDSPDLLVADRQAARARYLAKFSESIFRARTTEIINDLSVSGPRDHIAPTANIERQAGV